MRVAILGFFDESRAGVHHYTRGLINSLEQLDSEIEYIIIEKKTRVYKELSASCSPEL
jgi:hypothetical protein